MPLTIDFIDLQKRVIKYQGAVLILTGTKLERADAELEILHALNRKHGSVEIKSLVVSQRNK
jgi:hypothetical protein